MVGIIPIDEMLCAARLDCQLTIREAHNLFPFVSFDAATGLDTGPIRQCLSDELLFEPVWMVHIDSLPPPKEPTHTESLNDRMVRARSLTRRCVIQFRLNVPFLIEVHCFPFFEG
jgi:hypothetical protein